MKWMLARLTCALVIAALASCVAASSGIAAESPCPAILDHKFANLMDEPVSLCQFRGKVLLIVNTASECGYTPQYEGLEALYRKYRQRGLVVLGFPMNDFGGQEPGSNQQIAQFCVNQYAIDFPMFAKTGLKTNPLFAELAQATGQSPRWNFHKYLVDRGGRAVQSFDTRVAPGDPRLVTAIEKLLAEKP
jgi:glutathione peroxidase